MEAGRLRFRSDPSRRRVSFPADEATDHSAINTLALAMSVADMGVGSEAPVSELTVSRRRRFTSCSLESTTATTMVVPDRVKVSYEGPDTS